jgi:hypothetical protein
MACSGPLASAAHLTRPTSFALSCAHTCASPGAHTGGLSLKGPAAAQQRRRWRHQLGVGRQRAAVCQAAAEAGPPAQEHTGATRMCVRVGRGGGGGGGCVRGWHGSRGLPHTPERRRRLPTLHAHAQPPPLQAHARSHLIEQQQGGRGKQRARERDAHPPATCSQVCVQGAAAACAAQQSSLSCAGPRGHTSGPASATSRHAERANALSPSRRAHTHTRARAHTHTHRERERESSSPLMSFVARAIMCLGKPSPCSSSAARTSNVLGSSSSSL